MLKILGAGLPRTGTATLCEALRILKYITIHHEPDRMPLFPTTDQNWRLFDDVDAVTDAPAAMYWRELSAAYPECKVILTVRDVDSWWESIKWHSNKIRISDDTEHCRYTEALHSALFGVPSPSEYWYKRRFREHNAAVARHFTLTAPSNLIIMDIQGGDKWSKLCKFLQCKEPNKPWPWENKKPS